MKFQSLMKDCKHTCNEAMRVRSVLSLLLWEIMWCAGSPVAVAGKEAGFRLLKSTTVTPVMRALTSCNDIQQGTSDNDSERDNNKINEKQEQEK